MKSRFAALGLAVLAGTGLLAACGDSGGSSDKDTTVRLGFFPNITHATALVGVQKGFYAKYLGKAPKTLTFNAGPAATEAIFSGAVDATYVGPNPAINAYAKSHGQAIKIIAGSGQRRRLAHRQAGHQVGRRPAGQEDRHAAARQHPGRRAPLLPQAARPQDGQERRRRRPRHAAGQRPDPPVLPAGPDRRSVGARAVRLAAHPRGQGQEARRRGLAVARRQVRRHRAHGADRVPQEAPRPGEEAPPGPGRGERLHQPAPPRGRRPRPTPSCRP